MSVLKVIKKEK